VSEDNAGAGTDDTMGDEPGDASTTLSLDKASPGDADDLTELSEPQVADPARRRLMRQMIAGAVALVLVAAAVTAVFVWNDDDADAGRTGVGAQVGDHLHAFFGLAFCGDQAVPAPPSLPGFGIWSDGQGIVHVAPVSSETAGDNASLNRYLEPFGLALTPEGVLNVASGGVLFANGDPCPAQTPLAGQPAELAVSVNGSIISGDPGLYLPEDGDVIIVYYTAAGVYQTGAELLPTDPTTGAPVDPVALLGAVTEPAGYTPELATAQAACIAAPAPEVTADAPVQFPAAPALTVDAATTYTAAITTSCGDVVIELDAAAAPNTVNSFVFLAREGYYDNTPIHRVVPGFVVQGGDPTGTGSGGPGYSIADENLGANFSEGTLAMANSGPDTNGSQFFIVSDPAGAAQLNSTPNYSIFGQVVGGLDVVDVLDSLGDPDPNGSGQPLVPLYVLSVTITES
jgi:cyclophilin family peptidyl-prolyl cis-trans isomerase